MVPKVLFPGAGSWAGNAPQTSALPYLDSPNLANPGLAGT